MRINTTFSEEEIRKARRQKIVRFIAGILAGFLFFGLAGYRLFLYGTDSVHFVTWAALGFGVLCFGFMNMWFGRHFWEMIFRGIR